MADPLWPTVQQQKQQEGSTSDIYSHNKDSSNSHNKEESSSNSHNKDSSNSHNKDSSSTSSTSNYNYNKEGISNTCHDKENINTSHYKDSCCDLNKETSSSSGSHDKESSSSSSSSTSHNKENINTTSHNKESSSSGSTNQDKESSGSSGTNHNINTGSSSSSKDGEKDQKYWESRYLPIDAYGVVGNMRTAALIGINGSVDWLCIPHFDSPSVFAKILDHDKGGFFRVSACNSSSKQHYWPDTNVLVTRFMSTEGVSQLFDFMPVRTHSAVESYARSQQRKATRPSVSKTSRRFKEYLVRKIEAVHGNMCFHVDCAPAFNYARDGHTVDISEDSKRVIFRSNSLSLVLESTIGGFKEMTNVPGAVHLEFCLLEGHQASFTIKKWIEKRRRRTLPQLFSLSPMRLSVSSQADEQQQERREEESGGSGNDGGDSGNSGGNYDGSGKSGSGNDGGSGKSGNEKNSEHQRYQQPELSGGEFNNILNDIPFPDNPCNSKYNFTTFDYVHGADEEDWDDPQSYDQDLASRCDLLFLHTIKYWQHWLSKCNYQGRYREDIRRSALVLKLMTFEKTGAIVASITTSLPECLGGVRNWDYRFTWIRDASFTLYAFMRIGFTKEAENFMQFLETRCKEMVKHIKKTKNPKHPPLQIMYGIDGSHFLPEEELPHLEGYKGSKPVRVGNLAHEQLQLDVYGELLDAVYLYNKYGSPISYDLWKYLRKILDWLCDNWHEPDEGIWEVRGGKKHFLYSKVMCWVAMDRGVRLAARRSFPCDSIRWTQVRDTIYEEIMRRGYNRELQAFTQHYESSTLDASALILPLVFFVSPNDPRMLKTIDAINRSPKNGGLATSNLVYRYDSKATDDGFNGQEEGTFNMCTFWLIEALTRAGANGNSKILTDAQMMFEQMLSYSNHLRLFSEQMSFSGVALGNFPQAFTHLALISAGFNLNRYLGSGKN